MTSVYCYNIRDEPPDPNPGKGARVKHIFTGPHGGLKVQATSLFLKIQEGIELGWQSVTTGVAEGISTHVVRQTLLFAEPVQANITLGRRPVTVGSTRRSQNAFAKRGK